MDDETAALAAMADVVIRWDAAADGDDGEGAGGMLTDGMADDAVDDADEDGRSMLDAVLDGAGDWVMPPERRQRMERGEFHLNMAEAALSVHHPRLAGRIAGLRAIISDHLDGFLHADLDAHLDTPLDGSPDGRPDDRFVGDGGQPRREVGA